MRNIRPIFESGTTNSGFNPLDYNRYEFTTSQTITITKAGRYPVYFCGGGGSGAVARNDAYMCAMGGFGGEVKSINLDLEVGDTVTFTIGAGGATETTVGHGNDGNAGGNTTIAVNGIVVATANGGIGGIATPFPTSKLPTQGNSSTLFYRQSAVEARDYIAGATVELYNGIEHIRHECGVGYTDSNENSATDGGVSLGGVGSVAAYNVNSATATNKGSGSGGTSGPTLHYSGAGAPGVVYIYAKEIFYV